MDKYTITGNPQTRTNLFEYTPADNRAAVILIIEDDEDSRLMLKLLLEMWKYQVVEATDGWEAVRLAETLRFDLILTDVKLPQLDGFETTRRLRESENTNRVPIIILSGCAEDNYRRTARAVGADDYLVKPINFELLENTLKKYLVRQPTNSRENP
ncbi:MAG: response regulator [Pyrinomonadaceae bacterium]